MKEIITKFIKKAFNKVGFQISRTQEKFSLDVNKPYFKNRLLNLKNLNFSTPIIIDGGAHLGNWTKLVSEFYPSSKYILIEPNPKVSDKIDQNLKYLGIEYTVVAKALGSKKGNLKLNIWEDIDQNQTGSSVCEHVRGNPTSVVDCEVIELDDVIEIYNQVPNLVKLDLQGYELEALKGAKEILKSAEVFILEFGCLDAYIGRTSINDLVSFMDGHDYKLYDIIDMHYRPYDNALTGGDFIFVKNTSNLKKYKGWE